MNFRRINNNEKGLLFSLLSDSYTDSPLYNNENIKRWQEFDKFVFDNYELVKEHIILSIENTEIIGFISWDPRGLPDNVRIGHNSISRKYKGRGKGKAQLLHGITNIKYMKPKRILVSTGNIPFFIPAQRMYESCGFQRKEIIKNNDLIVPEIIEYEMLL